jgi:nucleotide-binding universal stress UspA family protein
LIGWSFVGSGLMAWHRRRTSRFGALMMAVGFAWFAWGADTTQMAENAEAMLQKTLSEVLGRLAAGAVDARVAEGNAAKVLIDLYGSADLLVVGVPWPRWLAELLLGSVSQQVMAHAQCSVVVVR